MTDKTKPRKQLHMAVMRRPDPADGVECNYCDQAATWYHFAVPSRDGVPGERGVVDRDHYACDEHVRLLNKYPQ